MTEESKPEEAPKEYQAGDPIYVNVTYHPVRRAVAVETNSPSPMMVLKVLTNIMAQLASKMPDGMPEEKKSRIVAPRP